MKHWERFTSFKLRGEWVELQFMAAAAQRRLAVSKPWGDTQAYDVGIENGENYLRVQVKSTTARSGAGYRCMFLPNHQKKRDYSLQQIDVFAAYVIPEDAWYLIPAALILGNRRLTMAMLCPVVTPAKKASYRYECYREAWKMLEKNRTELVAWGRRGKRQSKKMKRVPHTKRRALATFSVGISTSGCPRTQAQSSESKPEARLRGAGQTHTSGLDDIL